MKAFIKPRDGQSQNSRTLVVLLCVLLMLFVGTTQALHIHASGEVANPGCSLCAVAHVTALPAPALAVLIVAETVAPVGEFYTTASPRRFFSFSLYVRPPPVSTTQA